jgi:hypothetical protein
MRTILRALAPGLLAAVGCFSPQLQPEKSPASPPLTRSRPAPRVTPEQVTPENAHQKCEALRRELEESCREVEDGM